MVRKPTLPLAAGLVALLVVTLLGEAPALAQPDPSGWEPPEPPPATDVPVTDLQPTRPDESSLDAAVAGEQPVAWPAAGSAVVELPTSSAAVAGLAGPDGAPAATRPGRVAAGDLPVRVGAAPLTLAQLEDVTGGAAQAQAAAPAQVRVQVSDREAATRAGVSGLLLGVARADGRRLPAQVTVEVAYAGFRHAYGGDWASRLRLSVVECEADLARCGPTRPLPTGHDRSAGVLAAEVPLSGDGAPTMLAVSADPAGDNGDYTATSLSPAATWQVSQQTGDFSWSYPLRAVPGLGGPEPDLALSYSSGGVDGRTASTNTQGSWIGDGWDLWPGFIERSYRPCLDDTDPVGGRDPNNRDRETGDLCWFSDNATLSLNGQATELVKGSDGRYHGVADDGSRIELLTSSGLGNGDDNGEYWKVTTVDGVQYFFGRHRRPGDSQAATNSAWTVPVYGNHPGEPCHATGDFAGSRCAQAWRWNLDYVVDPNGNSMSLFYQWELGAYGRELDPAKRTHYRRGGYLTRIEYGTRTGAEADQPAPARMVFDTADRCKPDSTCTTANPSAWPDVPWDQFCDAAPCTDQLAPTFWTQKRLAKIRAEVRRGSGFSTVESWTLRHEYLNAGAQDGEGVPMWLRGITRTGHVTTAGDEDPVTDPEVDFHPGGKALPNRVDGPSDDRTALKRWRIHTITTESGAQIGVGYLETECTRASLPTPHTNGKRCFPQWYAPPGAEPTLDWFHKYVVARVDVWDRTGAGGHRQTSYQYLDAPAWHYDDSELVPADKRTWAQWRGYSKVRVWQGAAGTTRSRTDYLYLRGMHGDRAGPSGGDSKSVQVTDSQDDPVDDHRAYQGFLREKTVHDGTAWVSGSIHTPWRKGPTATAGPLRAFVTGTATTRTRTALDGGEDRWSRTDTVFDDIYGMPEREHDHGDLAVAGDSTCTRWEYARNRTKWILNRVSRTELVGVPCLDDPSRPDDVLSDQRTYFDDPGTHGAAPTHGRPVRTDEVGSWQGTTPQWVTTSRTHYDSYGRAVEVRDALDRRTTTSFTPTTGGPVTGTTTINPLGHTTTSELEPAWQFPTRTTDPNGHVTDLTYDGLGRLTGVWLPGRDRATETASMRFSYLVRGDRPSAVTTETLLPTGNRYRTSITLLDGQLRQRQTQTQATGGGRVITDTVHDTRGLVAWESRGYYNSGDPATTLVGTAGEPQIPGITEYRHDGAGRVVAEIFQRNGQEAWRTSYSYGGDRVRTTPPAGGTATTTVTDARGQTVELWQHHGPEPAGGHDTTRYAYTKRGELATVTDHAGNTWSYTYDQRGRRVESADPDRGRTVTSYDAAGQERTVTDARAVTLGYTYDGLGRRTSVRDGSLAGPVLAEWVYDTLDNGFGRPTRSIRHAGGERYVSEVTGYDGAGRPGGTRVVIPASEDGLAGTYTTGVSYRPDGSVWTSTLPELGDVPSELVLYSYDDVGAQTTFTSGHWQYVSDAVYDKLGELTQRTLGPDGSRVAVTSFLDEPTGRLAGMSAVPELQSQVLDLAYAYDDAGNLLRIADSPSSAAPEDTQCFRYDYLRRLTAAWTPAGTGDGNCAAAPAAGELGGPAPYWQSWTYDHAGNRITQTVHGGAGDTVTTYLQGSASPHAVTRAGTTGPGGSRESTYDYDAVGSMTARNLPERVQGLDYDLEGHLSTVTEDGAPSSYLYDADGNRLIARDPDGATLYLPAGQELRWDRATGDRTGTRYYSHAGATVAVRTGAGVSWLLGDHHGTAEATVDADQLDRVARRRTTPFGEPRGPEPGFWVGDKGFVGGTEDPTGLTQLGAREYDPQLGRFLTVDPIIDHQDPQQMHGYAYANNAPPSFTDPDGLRACGPDGAGCRYVKDGAAEANTGSPRVSGTEQHGTSWSVSDGKADINGWLLPDDGPNVAKLAYEIDRILYSRHLAAEDTYMAIAWYCEDGRIKWCGGDFYAEAARRDLALHEDDIMVAAAIGGPGFGQPPSAGARLRLGRIYGPRLVGQRNGWCRNSFLPDTLVLMADGTRKPIEDVEIGDRVLATDPETGESGPRPVTATISSDGDKDLVEIDVNLAASTSRVTLPGHEFGSPAAVTATEDHPFWVSNRESWTAATDLRPGDRLVTADGGEVPVTAVASSGATLTVYNLTVADLHTYYVLAGNTAVLVHNCPRDFPTRNTNNWSARFGSEREARALARTQIGNNPIEYSPYKWRSQDGRWQYRARPSDIADRHIHLEQLNPSTGEVIQNVHLRW